MERFREIPDEILGAFAFEGMPKNAERITDGHINNTFALTFEGDSGKVKRYLLQELNTNVFRQPEALMNNVVGVTEFLRKKIIAAGGDSERECLTVIPSKDSKPYFISSDGRFWRCFNFIENTYTLQKVESAESFAAAARAFGNFQCLLSDYPAETLVETIPNFHNTASRFADFKKALADNLSGRADNCKEETDFILKRESDCSVLVDMTARGELPLRVTHNDTKLNNVMFDNETGEGICVVDLDTVMPGLALYDFGDSIRFGASTAAEDEPDLEKVHFSPEYFEAYTDGFLATAGSALTDNEINLLAFSSKLMTLECGMRFLGDYINGDTYFKTDYPDHNLVRARTQLKLVAEMEEKMQDMIETVSRIRKKYGI